MRTGGIFGLIANGIHDRMLIETELLKNRLLEQIAYKNNTILLIAKVNFIDEIITQYITQDISTHIKSLIIERYYSGRKIEFRCSNISKTQNVKENTSTRCY